MIDRSNLVIVCAGDESLHVRYIGSQRSYDLCVIYFGGQKDRYRDHCEHYLASSGSQTRLLHLLFEQKPELLDRYTQFWLPDDDLETNTEDVNRLFELFGESDFAIAQPSLAPDSDASLSMLTCKGLGSCEINFVEIMCPLFTRQSLKLSIQYLAESVTGWGVDELWSVHALERGEKLGIFDQVQIGHYRPVGSAGWYQTLKIEPRQELKELKQRHGLVDRIKTRLHPLYEATVPAGKDDLPASSPFIIGGCGGSGTPAVAEILLRSNRFYLDVSPDSDDPGSLNSFGMRAAEGRSGQIDAALISEILRNRGSADYQWADLPLELQQELLARGRSMQALMRENARDGSAMQDVMTRLGKTRQRRDQWGWKEPLNLYFLPLWKVLYGRFRFIHVVRDPRSISDRHRVAGAQFHEALFGHAPVHERDGFERCWAKTNLDVFHWASREIAPHNYLLLRAEDLATQDEKARRETSRLLNFVGLDFADRRKTDVVFKPIHCAPPVPREGLVAEALRTFGYVC